MLRRLFRQLGAVAAGPARESPHEEARKILLPLAERASGRAFRGVEGDDKDEQVVAEFVNKQVLALLLTVERECAGHLLACAGPSGIPGAGTGLFAGARGAEPGECICLFGGRVFVPPPMGVEVLSDSADGTGGSGSGKELLRSDGIRIDPGIDCTWLPGPWASGALVNDGLLLDDGGGRKKEEEEEEEEARPRPTPHCRPRSSQRESANVVPADVCCAAVVQGSPFAERQSIAKLLEATFVPHAPWYVDAEELAPVDPPTLEGCGLVSPFGAALLATRRLEPGEEIFLDYRTDVMEREEGRKVHGSIVA